MSTAVTAFNPGQLPAFAKNRTGVGVLTKSLAGGEGGFSKRISIKGGVFRLVAGGKEVAQIDERFLDIVIINAAPKISRIFYKDKWKGDEVVSPPTCWSSDGDAPDKDVFNKPAKTCADCPNNIKGSGDIGDSRACRYQHRIAVVLANDMEGDIMQVSLPSKSLFGKEENGIYPLQAYARWLAAQNIEANEVVTRMRFDTSVESPKVGFKTMRWLTDEEYGMATEQSQKPDAIEAVKLTVAQVDGVKAEKEEQFEQAKPEAPAAKQEPAKQEAKGDEEPPPPPPATRKGKGKAAADPAGEPTVRKQADPPEPPKREGISKLVAQWDTDD